MSGKADFTEQEWETILEGPTSAGLLVSAAQRGGTFRESFAMAKAFADARQAHGESQLLDEIVSRRPKVDHARAHSSEELRERSLQHIRDAMALLRGKASPQELEEYRQFVISLAERVAGAKTEAGDEAVSDSERAAIDEIRQALA